MTSPDFSERKRPLPPGVTRADWAEVAPRLQEYIRAVTAGALYPAYLFGNAGRGKTAAAACVFCAWPGSVEWWNAGALVADITACRRSQTGSIVQTGPDGREPFDVFESTILRWVANAGLVVLDDIGRRIATESQADILLTIVDARHGKPLITTSNLDGQQLVDAFDGRLASRLLSGTIINVAGDDRRLRGRKVWEA